MVFVDKQIYELFKFTVHQHTTVCLNSSPYIKQSCSISCCFERCMHSIWNGCINGFFDLNVRAHLAISSLRRRRYHRKTSAHGRFMEEEATLDKLLIHLWPSAGKQLDVCIELGAPLQCITAGVCWGCAFRCCNCARPIYYQSVSE